MKDRHKEGETFSILCFCHITSTKDVTVTDVRFIQNYLTFVESYIINQETNDLFYHKRHMVAIYKAQILHIKVYRFTGLEE